MHNIGTFALLIQAGPLKRLPAVQSLKADASKGRRYAGDFVHGCGICKGLKGCFDITPETGTGTKDTMLLKKAGAKQVYLIRAFKENLREALEEALKLVPEGTLVLCESNSVRLVSEPALFVMIQSCTSSSIKPTAEAVMGYADVILPQNEESFADFVQGELYQKLKLYFSELN